MSRFMLSAPISRLILSPLLGFFYAATFLTSLPAARGIQFEFEAEEGTSQAVIDAFTEAGQMWADRLADNITIRLSIGFSQLDPDVIGQTSIGYYFVETPPGDPLVLAPSYTDLQAALAARATSVDDFSAVAHLPSGSTYSRLINHTLENGNSSATYVDTMDWVGVTRANAKALGFSLSDPDALDGTITFNSLYTFDLTHETIDAGAFDFVGAAAHEIGHVLGFVSGVDDIDTGGGTSSGSDFSSNLIDLFRYSEESLAAGPGITDYTADNRDKYFSVDGGATAIALFSNGTEFGDGNQASHWKDDQQLGLMDPTAAQGEQINISTNDERAMDVIGYTLVPEPATGLLLALAGIGFGLCRRPRG